MKGFVRGEDGEEDRGSNPVLYGKLCGQSKGELANIVKTKYRSSASQGSGYFFHVTAEPTARLRAVGSAITMAAAGAGESLRQAVGDEAEHGLSLENMETVGVSAIEED